MQKYRKTKKWKEYNKAYWQRPAVKEKKKVYGRQWYTKYRTKYNADRVSWRQFYRDKLFEILGGAKCSKCGFSDKRALQFDHINGGGTYLLKVKERKDHHYYVKYANNPELARQTFQILCANCNCIKRHIRYKSPIYNMTR